MNVLFGLTSVMMWFQFDDKMVKEKVNSIRTYDEEGFKRRAACVCVKDKSEKEVCVIMVIINILRLIFSQQ